MLLGPAVALTAWLLWPVPDAVPIDRLPLAASIDAVDGDHHKQAREAPAGPAPTCLPFLAPALQQPSWQLRMSSGYSGCFEGDNTGEFTIASTGEVTWTKPGWPVRHLTLSSEHLARLRRLDQLSCVTLDPFDLGRDRDWAWIGLGLGKVDKHTTVSVSRSSALGTAVTSMFDELMEEYREPRRKRLGSIDLQLATTEPGPVYRARVTGGRLTIKRDRKLLVDRPVAPDLLVDVVEAILEGRAADAPDLKGALRIEGRSVPVAVRLGPGPFWWLHNEIFQAEHSHDPRVVPPMPPRTK